MNRTLSIILMCTVIFGGGYFYYVAEAICDAPLSYRVGTIAPEFGLSREEARAAITDAESLWEDATGRNLFSYDETAKFSINFIYDGRQAETDARHQLENKLEVQKDMSDELKAQYQNLSDQYAALKETYEAKVASYETRLKAHNDEVAKWNAKGGAPEDVYAGLNAEQTRLAKEQKELNTTAYQLNQLVGQINNLGEKGNALVSTYNNIVQRYNNRFDTEREFTQGDYRGTEINIYQYDSPEELRTVLAHELGHALSLGHVATSESVMYHHMEDQVFAKGLSPEDLSEFEGICGETTHSKLSRIRSLLTRMLGGGW